MRARVTHTLTYRYSAPVLLGPHRFCLKPGPWLSAAAGLPAASDA
jgi:Bacterial transglutaminase-like N-terminal region.